MRWQSRPSNKREWHRWFAWHPIKIDHQWVWLETVHRKWMMNPGDYCPTWHYRIEAGEAGASY
jgi:hypothetical protein